MENVYKDKFVDRCPGSHAAGILTKIPGNTVERCLKVPEKYWIYFVEKEKPVCYGTEYQKGDYRKEESHTWPPVQHSELWKLFKANDLSPYQLLTRELNESVYSSHWRSPLGQRIHLPMSPTCFSPEQLTHGVSIPNIPAGDVINPPKSHCEVLQESEIGKDLYKISHEDYDPGEQINRNYGGKFDPCGRFGKNTPHFNDGRRMKRVLKWAIEDPVSYVSVRQADFIDSHRSHLGKSRSTPYCPTLTAPEQSKFGICLGKKSNARQLLGGGSDCSAKLDQLVYLEHINKIRIDLKKKNFSFKDLLNTFKNLDEKCCGYLPITIIDCECRKHRIYINKPIIKLMKILEILDESQCVNVSKFVDLLNWQIEFPLLPKVDESHDREFDYKTIHSLSMTGEITDTSDIRSAGIPCARQDMMYPRPRRDLRADIESLEGETDVYALISPSIFTAYGVTHRDLFKPRSSSEIEKIFAGIGIVLPPDLFNELWKEGCCVDKTGGVCIETFRNLLQKLAAKNMLNT